MAKRSHVGWALTCAALVASSACTGDAMLVVVDLRTDYAPGLEVDRVETDIDFDLMGPPARSRRESTRLTFGQDVASGARIAEFRGVPRGTHTVVVRLFDARGEEVATRRIRATVTATISIVAIITRNCRGVVCPRAGAPDATECLGGQCVPPECTTAEGCIELMCAGDGDCPSEGCAVGECASGACLLRPRDDRCSPGQRCHPDDGCVAVDEPDGGMDAGARDSGPPPECRLAAECDDGVACTADSCVGGACERRPDDSRCDDGVACTTDSCGPAGCASAPSDAACDDGLPCTVDTCGPTGCVHAASCDDGVPCTVDSCGPTGCVHAPNDGACDDGVACTTDSCTTGGCARNPNDGACDDGVACTDDVCTATGCTNPPRNARCSDGNPCTDDTCTASGCRYGDNSNPCDDGVFCNGPDTCGGGSCSVHAGNPCNVAADEICSE